MSATESADAGKKKPFYGDSFMGAMGGGATQDDKKKSETWDRPVRGRKESFLLWGGGDFSEPAGIPRGLSRVKRKERPDQRVIGGGGGGGQTSSGISIREKKDQKSRSSTKKWRSIKQRVCIIGLRGTGLLRLVECPLITERETKSSCWERTSPLSTAKNRYKKKTSCFEWSRMIRDFRGARLPFTLAAMSIKHQGS